VCRQRTHLKSVSPRIVFRGIDGIKKQGSMRPGEKLLVVMGDLPSYHQTSWLFIGHMFREW
jgi:hypothetical protein